MVSVEKALDLCGWTLVREKKHAIWRCPCGKHQIARPKTPSDWRGDKNSLGDLLKTECPSLEALKEDEKPKKDPKAEWPEAWRSGRAKPTCRCCGKTWNPEDLGKTFWCHDEMVLCKTHHGSQEWHASQVKLGTVARSDFDRVVDFMEAAAPQAKGGLCGSRGCYFYLNFIETAALRMAGRLRIPPHSCIGLVGPAGSNSDFDQLVRVAHQKYADKMRADHPDFFKDMP